MNGKCCCTFPLFYYFRGNFLKNNYYYEKQADKIVSTCVNKC